MSLLSRLQDAEKRNPGMRRNRGVGIESVRSAVRERLEAAEAEAKAEGLRRIARDERTATVWMEVFDRLARDERLENLGGYA